MYLRSKLSHVLLAALVAALVVLPIAIAGAHTSGAPRKKSATASKQIKALTRQLAALRAQVAEIASKPTPTAPTALPPKGPAGGDLAGTYPDPKLRDASVNGTTVADQSLTGDDIATGAIGGRTLQAEGIAGVDLGDGSVGPRALAPAQVVVGAGVAVAENQVEEAKVSCPAGTRLLSGGFEWKNNAKTNGDIIVATGPDIGKNPNTDWEAVGHVVKGGESNEVRAVALCMVAS